MKVIIIGGGVAGMSAAQELAERSHYDGLEIQVYEANPAIPGGKARSLPVPGSGVDGRPDLPAEHGFRVFLGSYRHVTDSMKRIPYGQRSVYDNLVEGSRLLFARLDKPPFFSISRFPRSVTGFGQILQSLFDLEDSGLTVEDLEFFGRKLWQIATSCYERRVAEYEKVTWWQFIEADKRSKAYQDLLANGISRSITANDPHRGNAKTIGDFSLDSFLSVVNPGSATSKILNGPTNEVWIDPWKAYLESMGVSYRLGAKAESIQCEEGRIQSVKIKFKEGHSQYIQGDYFIFAVPVEAMAALLEADQSEGQAGPLLKSDPTLGGIMELKEDVAWMNGLIFYLNEHVPIVHGHQLYVQSPWALTGVSQIQFWETNGYQISQHGDGQVKGILSMIISNWHEPGLVHQKPAKLCTPEEIKDEVWTHMKRSLNVPGQDPVLTDKMLHSWFLDPDIEHIQSVIKGETSLYHNTEPLLIHPVNRWHLRPNAHTQIPNMFLASDYVRTHMDAATMESANEAARRAVNRLLGEIGSRAPRCKIWPLYEPKRFVPARLYDLHRFRRGLPWRGDVFLGRRF